LCLHNKCLKPVLKELEENKWSINVMKLK
jgi:hypothetical protein